MQGIICTEKGMSYIISQAFPFVVSVLPILDGQSETARSSVVCLSQWMRQEQKARVLTPSSVLCPLDVTLTSENNQILTCGQWVLLWDSELQDQRLSLFIKCNCLPPWFCSGGNIFLQMGKHQFSQLPINPQGIRERVGVKRQALRRASC